MMLSHLICKIINYLGFGLTSNIYLGKLLFKKIKKLNNVGVGLC